MRCFHFIIIPLENLIKLSSMRSLACCFSCNEQRQRAAKRIKGSDIRYKRLLFILYMPNMYRIKESITNIRRASNLMMTEQPKMRLANCRMC